MSFISRGKILFFSVVGIFLFGSFGVVFYHDIPGADAALDVVTGVGAVGWRKDDVAVAVDGKMFKAKAYRAKLSPGNSPVIFLAGVPILKPDGSFAVGNLKVWRYRLAQFNDGCGRDFVAAAIGMIAGQGAGDSYYLEDDIKGWSAKYQIADRGDTLFYCVFPTPEHPGELSFVIPKSYFDDASTTGASAADNQIVDGSTLTVLPYHSER